VSLTFLPWVRSAAADAATVPASGTRPVLDLALAVNGQNVFTSPPALELIGPGDVVGFDTTQVIRTDPVAGATGFEQTRFAVIEFDHPALPWLLSPGAPGAGQLTPWICLAVVEDIDGVTLQPGPRTGSLVLQITDPADATAELPDPTSAWAWAHAQVAGTLDGALTDIDASTPERTLSRLICPRVLEAQTSYLACVVPVFEAGRLAGLGQDPGTSTAAWSATTAMTLPVYFSWRFTTGPAGDFFQLATQLTPGICLDLGLVTLDLSTAGLSSGGQPITGQLAMGGALQPAGASPPGDPGSGVRAALAAATSPAGQTLPSPVYGAAYCGQRSFAADATGWAAELNLDPRWRVAAAAGVSVVQSEHDDLIAAAWEQAGEITEVNAALDRAKLARAATAQLAGQHLAAVDPVTLARVTAPAHTRLLSEAVSGATVQAALTAADGSLAGRLSPSYRRLTVRPAAAALGPPAADPVLTGQLQAQLVQQLNAEATIPQRVLAGVQLPATPAAGDTADDDTGGGDGLASPATDPLGRVLVTPTFAMPMAAVLAQTAPDLLLPGAGSVSTDTVTLVSANPGFVAAFMIGLNGELGRTLTWEDFPVCRTGTFFRSFWDYRGQGAASPDLAVLDSAAAESALADLVGQAGQDLVLVIRSELLRRYPNTLLYAVPGTQDGTGPVLDDPASQLLPQFSGSLADDLCYFGFSLSADTARGTGTDPGWFFVLQEQLTQARFGPPDTGSAALGATAAAVAATYLRPAVRVVIQAARLLGEPA
jgi:hypothetical protein